MGNVLVGDVVIDYAEENSLDLSNDVTEKPVEDGGVITDHVNPQPDKLIIDNARLKSDESMSAEEKLNILKEYRENGKKISIVSNLSVYDDVVISSLNTRDDNTITNGYYLDIELQQIRIAQPDTVVVDLGEDAQAQAPEPDHQQPEDEQVDDDTMDSFAYRLLNPEDDEE